MAGVGTPRYKTPVPSCACDRQDSIMTLPQSSGPPWLQVASRQELAPETRSHPLAWVSCRAVTQASAHGTSTLGPLPLDPAGPPHSSSRTPASVQTAIVLRMCLPASRFVSGLVPLPAWNSLQPQPPHLRPPTRPPTHLSVKALPSRDPSLTLSHVDSISSLKTKQNCSTELAVCVLT